ncbi:Flavonoid-6-hydroxylase-like protein [Drosera capensis]
MELAVSMAMIFVFLLFIVSILKIQRRSIPKDKRLPPEAKGALPFIGHLHLLSGSRLLHRMFDRMADVYGPIFTVRIGVHRALIVSSWELAKECLQTNDKVFVDRPKSTNIEIMGYNNAIFGFSPFGPYWRELRRIAIQELLTSQRIKMLEPVRVFEVRTAIKAIYDTWMTERKYDSDKVVIEMKNWFGDINMNMALRMVAGKRLTELDGSSPVGSEEAGPCRQAFREFFNLALVFVVSDSIPALRWFDIGGYKKAMKEAAKRMDCILQGLLDEHKRKPQQTDQNGHQDFIYALLSIIDGSNPHLPRENADVIIKSTCLSLLLGGSDTTTVTLTWALSLLVNNPQVLKKAQDELDEHVERDRQVNDSDTKHLVYLQAIIKETMRLYPAGPILAPRESVTDCIVAGYHVPARTRLMINLWKLQNDPKVWPNPSEFQPERFLTSHQNVDVWGQNFELLPFGSGKRMCIGINFSLQIMALILGSLLHSFHISLPSGKPIDMSESSGLSNIKATPLEVWVSPRLPPHVYTQFN